jgi:arylsulfatase
MFMRTRGWTNQLLVVPLLVVGLALTYSIPVQAQQIYGTPGSPSATRSIDGKQLPPPPMKFGGKIERNAAQSKPWWHRALCRLRPRRTSS